MPSRSSRLSTDADTAASAAYASAIKLTRQRIVVLERLLPDAARQPVALRRLHQLEELGLLAVLVQPARALLHRRAARVGLDATVPAARTAAAAEPDHHVPDLAGRAPAVPPLPVEHDRATDARAPPHREERGQFAARAELDLRARGGFDVVRDLHRLADQALELLRERERVLPAAREVRGLRDRAGFLVDRPRRADADPGQVTCRLAGGGSGLRRRRRRSR